MMSSKTFLITTITFLFVFLLISNVHAGTYIGDLCWQIETEEDGNPHTAIMQVAVTDMGNGHYFLNGTICTLGDNEPPISAINGNAELLDDKVFMTLYCAAADPDEMDVDILSIVLNLPSLNGTVHDMNISYEYEYNSPEISYDAGIITLISCQQ